MILRVAILLLLGCLQIVTSARASEPWVVGDKGFVTGLNGHALTLTPDTDIHLGDLIATLQKTHVAIYRFDLPPNPNWRSLDLLVDALDKCGIAPLPILIPPGNRSGSLSPQEVNDKAYAYAVAIGQRYKGRIHYWEISNELDTFCLWRKGDITPNGQPYKYNAPDGWDPVEYSEKRYQVALGTLRGLSRGLRSVDPTARLVVDSGGWLHVGFLDRLQRDKLDFDILGWHWYSDYGDIRKVQGKPLLDHLASYKKPIWITEGNYWPKTGVQDVDKPQADYLQAVLSDFSGLYPIIQAYCVYTLLDSNRERPFGIIHVEKTLKGWQMGKPKPALDVLSNYSPD